MRECLWCGLKFDEPESHKPQAQQPIGCICPPTSEWLPSPARVSSAKMRSEVDPYAVEWLRNLIKSGKLPDGEINGNPIEKLTAREINGFDQYHLAAIRLSMTNNRTNMTPLWFWEWDIWADCVPTEANRRGAFVI